MRVFTLRLSDENYQYLKECAKVAGVSMNTVTETLVDACRRQVLRVSVIRTTSLQIQEPDDPRP